LAEKYTHTTIAFGGPIFPSSFLLINGAENITQFESLFPKFAANYNSATVDVVVEESKDKKRDKTTSKKSHSKKKRSKSIEAKVSDTSKGVQPQEEKKDSLYLWCEKFNLMEILENLRLQGIEDPNNMLLLEKEDVDELAKSCCSNIGMKGKFLVAVRDLQSQIEKKDT